MSYYARRRVMAGRENKRIERALYKSRNYCCKDCNDMLHLDLDTMLAPSDQSRYWCLTISDPSDYDVVNSDKIKLVVWGRQDKMDGTSILQGFVSFFEPQRAWQVKNLFPRAYIAVLKGTVKDAIKYCRKNSRTTVSGCGPYEEPDTWVDNTVL